MTEWTVEVRRGTAASLHATWAPDDAVPRVVVLVVDRPAIVLGSTQPIADVDEDAAAASGVDIVRRRSGGGAVWVTPDDPVWLDVWLPRGHRLWTDDVGRAVEPIGSAFAAALVALGVGADLAVHRGAMSCPPGARQVCFVGTGPGEVRGGTDGALGKVVGISQRRSRAGARFQCALYRHWDPAPLAAVLSHPPPSEVLASAGLGLVELGVDGGSARALSAALAGEVSARLTAS